MSPEELRRGDRLALIADACRRLHGARRFRDDFDMFEIQRGYLRVVQERGFRLPDRYLDFEPQNDNGPYLANGDTVTGGKKTLPSSPRSW